MNDNLPNPTYRGFEMIPSEEGYDIFDMRPDYPTGITLNALTTVKYGGLDGCYAVIEYILEQEAQNARNA